VPESKITNPKLFIRIVEFSVLGSAFFLSCLMLSVDIAGDLFIQALIYAMILAFFVRFAKGVGVRHKKSPNYITRQILCNAVGILVGTCAMLLLEKMFAIGDDIFVAVICSGVMAFFILGTLSPLEHKKSSSIR